MPGDLELTPFGDPSPAAGGVVVELRVANPDYPEELARYQAALERNPFASDTLVETFSPTFQDQAESLIDADGICVDVPRLTLVVGYPFPGQYAVTVDANSPAGFTRAALFRQLVRAYSALYDGATFSPAPLALQTRVDSPRFGTAWHRLDELAIERIVIEKRDHGRTLAWISIGS